MRQEIDALEQNGTWILTSLPPGKRALGSKWVYRIKYKADGTIERYKARLVILGNTQMAGIDFTDTFAPVAKMVTVRTLLSVAAARNWPIHQMDVHNAFLHGDLQEEVYMRPPPGFRPCYKGQSYADYSLFTYSRGNIYLCVLIYVDDLLITGNSLSTLEQFKASLHKCFHMKDLGSLKYFLGIEIARNSTGLFLSQRKYTLEILSEMGLLGAKPASTPVEPNHQLAKASGSLFDNPDSYRRLIGKLIYLTLTRPELAYAVHTLAQFMHAPRHAHWDAALRVVRYLKGSPGRGIFLSSKSPLSLTAYCDSDWATCPITRRSLTGYFISLGGSPISWKTKKQHTVSRSSAEAEYRSMAMTLCELKWLSILLRDLHVPVTRPIPLHCDNQAALHIAENPVFHERTKHIEIDCHFVRDAFQEGFIYPAYIRSEEQPADILTKALHPTHFHRLASKLGISDLHAPT
ncbi:hypothetical protein M9H77_11260 [Catharanthus roseus]|uniref:Uncharacterized protein n=1 Tax=Catharanthus roseus TaxID=4058 RepID=A0ACC0BE33_CATRO|nr:hypothetical protein M9H77_11260 [Catharanthus roseus]